MGKVSVFVRAVVDGKRRNLSIEGAQALGATGTYYIRWTENGVRKSEPVGTDYAAARMAALRKQRGFQGHAQATDNRVTLREAIDAFVLSRSLTQTPASIRRWRWELARFESCVTKTYLNDIDALDVEVYWRSFVGSAPRTIFNRVQSLLTFLKASDHPVALKVMPSYDEKDVDYYTENNPNELVKFFAACDEVERLSFMFFLDSGTRERETMFACWDDIDFTHRTYAVRPKPDLGFRTKNGLVRVVPLTQRLIDALKTYAVIVGPRRLIFTNSQGGPEGHFLYKCKQIAFKAGLNCGHCTNKKGLKCSGHPVCAKWSLHKFRRTWATMHLLSGTPITLIQHYIGHSDLETLNRYLARISAKTELAKQMSDNMARMANIQGTVAADVMADAVKV